jgi:hypothetical protein
VSAKRTPSSRQVSYETNGKIMSTWIQGYNQCHVPVSLILLQAKAIRYINEDLSKGDDNFKPFSASTCTGWFGIFMNRYYFHNIKMPGEAAFADTEAVTCCIH